MLLTVAALNSALADSKSDTFTVTAANFTGGNTSYSLSNVEDKGFFNMPNNPMKNGNAGQFKMDWKKHYRGAYVTFSMPDNTQCQAQMEVTEWCGWKGHCQEYRYNKVLNNTPGNSPYTCQVVGSDKFVMVRR